MPVAVALKQVLTMSGHRPDIPAAIAATPAHRPLAFVLYGKSPQFVLLLADQHTNFASPILAHVNENHRPR